MGAGSRKEDQRARLLRAMVEVISREGYATASIAQAISVARVSRSTFYEHFEDKLSCFLAVEQELGERLLAAIERSAHACEVYEVTQAVLRTLVEVAEEDPAGTRVLLNESLAAGPLAMDQRDRLIELIGRVVEDAWEASPAEAPAFDVPARALIGGACRLLSVRMLRGAGGLHGLLPDLLVWASSYTRTSGEPKWRTLDPKPGTPLPRSPHAEPPPSPEPTPLPIGRHSLPTAYVSSNQRERILQASIATMLEKGYTATTVGDIVADAHLTRAVFYRHFRDKQEVLVDINQVHFQQVMAVSARGFFSVEHWPERVWEGLHASGELNADNPALARIGFVETNAVGPESTRRTTDAMMALAIFLEEGYRHRPEAQSLPRLCSDAITTALCELLYWETRRGRSQQFLDLIPHTAYIVLAPFMGPNDANDFIEGKLREAGASSAIAVSTSPS